MPAPTSIYRPNLTPSAHRADAQDGAPQNTPGHGYYDVSILKPPAWRWQIAGYFFLGGLSAGSYLLARMADRFGGKDFRYVAKIGTYTACAAAVPCPVLVIWDLGDPARFHHMLRVFKPASAMSFGTWVLTAITPIAFGAAAREYITDQRVLARHPKLNVVVESVGVVADAAGIPLAILLATYTGVLLSNTANPIWCQNKFLAPMFAVGSFSTGIAAISLVHQIATYSKPRTQQNTRAEKTMEKLDTIGHIAEAGIFAAYLASLGPLRKAYTQTDQRKHVAAHFTGLAVAEALKYAPLPKKLQRPAKIASSILGLSAAFSLRWAIVHAAHKSAQNPDAARHVSRARNPQLQRHYAQFDLLAQQQPAKSLEDTRRAPQGSSISTLDPAAHENPRHR